MAQNGGNGDGVDTLFAPSLARSRLPDTLSTGLVGPLAKGLAELVTMRCSHG